MARGFLSGVIWGGVTSLAVAGVVSILAGSPTQPEVGLAAPEAGSAPATVDDGSLRAGNDADLAVEAGASAVRSPQADNVRAVAEAGADTPTVPRTGVADDLAGPGTVSAETGSVSSAPDAPVLPSPQAALPQAPASEAELSISTDPAQPPAPEVPAETSAFSAEIDEDTPVVPQAPVAGTQAQETPEVSSAPEVAALPETGAPATAPADDTTGTALILPSAEEAETGPARPRIGKPALSLVDRDAEEDEVAESVAAAPETPGGPPIETFAASYDDPGDKPLMSIVLIDDGVALGGGSIGVAALRSFPYPITFAVDASLADARDRVAGYRAEGFEVLALVDMPAGSNGSDAEVMLAAALDAVPEAVGVIEGTGTGIQSNREAAEQVIEALKQSGHGFVLQAQGLNTVQKLAAREGVPSAVVFRDFDSAGQSPTTIRRFLDQAAFRAGQEGRVIMLGRVRPDTISALLLWGLQDRASRVALVPVSAALTATVAGEG